jgi:uncharacterized phage protein gp47/JayE
MPSSADIAQQVRATLALSEPDLDTSIGSVAGKIIDAVSLPMAEAFLDQHLARYQYDIDSMTAGTLEGFVRLFGMNRKAARFAVGTVTFARSANTAAKGTATIPIGTQVMSNTNPVIYVQTTAGAVMAVGQTTVDIPVQTVAAGSAGNVAAGTLVNLVSDVPGLSTITTNAASLTSGQDQESDDTLRERWKTQVFRNLAGTRQMYRAMALQADDAVTAVNVLGSRKTWTDRVTITGGTSGPLSFGNPAYIYSTGVFVGLDLGTYNLLAQNTDYAVVINNTVNPATIVINAVASGGLADGNYDIQFDYVPTYSRNNPFATRFNEPYAVNNRIDVWVNGQAPVAVTQACKFISTVRFTNTSTDALYRGNFRTTKGAQPSTNDIFTPLAYVPVLSVPDTMTIGGTTFTEGTHYDIVHRSDAFGYTPNSVAGIVWYAAGSVPVSNTAFTVNYVYNQVPAEVQKSIETQWRLLGTDVRAHAGIQKMYRFHLGVIYERGSDTSAVNTAMTAAVSNLLAGLGFDSSLQVSDVIQTAHNVPGVDNVRFLNSTDDSTNYAIQQINTDGTVSATVATGGRATDVYFDDATYPQLFDLRILVKTRTNFGAA